MKAVDVVAAIIKLNSKFLIAQRNRKKHLGYKWEFPGGKVNSNESFLFALSREIKEELDIDIKVGKKIAIEKYTDDKINIILHYYLCTKKNGKIKLIEHENLAWVTKKQTDLYDMVEGDKKIVKFLEE